MTPERPQRNHDVDPDLTGVDVRGTPPGDAALAVIALHGRDQDPDWLHARVLSRLPDLPVVWLAPAAAGRHWYTGRVHDPLATTLDERERAAEALDALADALARDGRPAGQVVLAGFSQGACVVADHLLRRPRRWAAAVLWTAAAFGPPGTRWPPPSGPPPLDGVPVLVTNGADDDWIPRAATEDLAADLSAHGARTDLMIVPDRPHEVADVEIAAAGELLRGLLPG